MGKDSFILYTEQREIFSQLSDEDAGKLIKAIFNYSETGQEPELNNILKFAFIPIRQQLDRNTLKWEETKQKRVEAGRLGGINRAKNQGENLSSKSKQCLDMLSKGKQKQANQAVNVNVNVNGIKENIIKEKQAKKFVAPSLEDVNKYIQEKSLRVDGQQFYDYFTEGGWVDAKGNKVKNWKQKLLTWNKYSITSNTTNKQYQKYEQRTYNDFSKFYANNN